MFLNGLLSACLLLVFHGSVEAITFRINLPRSGRRCFYESVLQNTLVIVAASTSAQKEKVGLQVSENGKIVYGYADHPSTRTAFTSVHESEYEVCVVNHADLPAAITLSIDQGPEARDYSKIAKKEHLTPLMLALRRVEDQLRDYHKNLLSMRSKEARMTHLTESTSSRIVMFCLITIGVTFVATLLQILYFRSFLRSKKII